MVKLLTWQPEKNRDGPGFPGLNQEKWSEPGGSWFFEQFENTSFSWSEPLYLVWTTKEWSGPEISGLDHSFLVQTTGAERSRKQWYEPRFQVQTGERGSNQK